jgi:cardiolipin synthase
LKLIVQPGSGVKPFVDAINRAKNSVEIVIFRFDRREIEKALVGAANRGVSVQALIAYTNGGGQKHLRALEMRLLEAGVTVTRTADDLVRYHAKMLIIDRRELYVLGFNFTYADIERSRSFGVVTTNARFVREAVKLFEADTKRKAYDPGLAAFVVSPENSRKELTAFLSEAARELLIYDPKIADPAMIHLLNEKAEAGVKVRILGQLTKNSAKLTVRKPGQMRLHTRTILRDGKAIFVGSQSLRTIELDSRREVGIIFCDPKGARQISKTFEADWGPDERAERGAATEKGAPATKVAQKVAQAVAEELPPVGPVVADILEEVMGDKAADGVDVDELEMTIRETVRETVKDIVQRVIKEEHRGKETV